jgi:hypothetical protein
VIGGWLIPAFAHQWQDRKSERDLKHEIATNLDHDLTAAVIQARVLIDRRFPEAQTTDARNTDLHKAASPTRAAAQTALAAATERERDVGATEYIRGLSSWLVTRSVIRSTLEAYFPDADLARAWQTYANHVTNYIRLAAARGRPDRTALLTGLSAYLLGDSAATKWTALATTPVPGVGVSDAYAHADGELSDTLLQRKNDIVHGVLATHAAGFSTRPSDLVHDLLP